LQGFVQSISSSFEDLAPFIDRMSSNRSIATFISASLIFLIFFEIILHSSYNIDDGLRTHPAFRSDGFWLMDEDIMSGITHKDVVAVGEAVFDAWKVFELGARRPLSPPARGR
jgi:hypothetical protein